MSRGLGRRQREIVDGLTRCREGRERRGQNTDAWFWWANGLGCTKRVEEGLDDWAEPTRAEVEATRRAIRTLEARGLVEVKLEPRKSSPPLGACPAHLVVRLSVVHDQFKDNTYESGRHDRPRP
jgi:hypothetical protein